MKDILALERAFKGLTWRDVYNLEDTNRFNFFQDFGGQLFYWIGNFRRIESNILGNNPITTDSLKEIGKMDDLFFEWLCFRTAGWVFDDEDKQKIVLTELEGKLDAESCYELIFSPKLNQNLKYNLTQYVTEQDMNPITGKNILYSLIINTENVLTAEQRFDLANRITDENVLYKLISEVEGLIPDQIFRLVIKIDNDDFLRDMAYNLDGLSEGQRYSLTVKIDDSEYRKELAMYLDLNEFYKDAIRCEE
ncbi:MAG: hypothetical protein ABIH82_02200 [Candidatus Woesearchaeota archaeon]